MTGQQFATLRRSAGLTQKALAELVGLKEQYIQRIEYNLIKLENLSLRNGYALAKALKIEMEDFVK